jgi:hypothetical protein
VKTKMLAELDIYSFLVCIGFTIGLTTALLNLVTPPTSKEVVKSCYNGAEKVLQSTSGQSLRKSIRPEEKLLLLKSIDEAYTYCEETYK